MSNLAEQLKNLHPEEILDNLEANCLDVVEETYLEPLTDDELQDAKEKYADAIREIEILKDRLKALQEPIKEDMKPLQLEARESMGLLKEGGKWVSGKIYLLPDFDNRMMIKYNEFGRVVGQRPFTSKERQLSINQQNVRHLNPENNG